MKRRAGAAVGVSAVTTAGWILWCTRDNHGTPGTLITIN
jgi:hypothetical protein